LTALLSLVLPALATARTWTDSTGIYSIEADLIGFDDESVILQRQDKELGAFPIDKLSKKDREYLKSQEARQANSASFDRMQTWTAASGLKVVGRVVNYTADEMTLQRRRGSIYVNQVAYDNLPPIYQELVRRIVSHLENIEIEDREDLENWMVDLRGRPKSYKLEGVVFELKDGNEYDVPFFLFSEQDQRILKRGFRQWEQVRDDYDRADDHAFRLRSMAATYEQDRQTDRQIAMMNLNMQAIQAGLTSAWEVTLYPRPGNMMPPRWVVVNGRNSAQAIQNALQQNPGFVAGPVRRVSR
jgi:hypothetical protein